ncbi:MAG: CBS domain containing membrane protein [Methanomicrobiales archaeon 53_19]|uniref:CBS domain-containing protein n=1 Tax=Methanocalculus sp. TaxID=2004547 RepID=UPI0007488872|nr:CBS domain-containing protein [Methanocalculus sp.]KUK69613.1 MAG: CBS domain containing membrane protein [Methanocalculus sp. 52_23]KUL02933.1 MAG: CBS domain containing membrane protein [Methanomicrobiales archaeon 53_19]HIJ07172.1 CBS domain-containing protein [Methanocalculus sp.]
MIVREMMSAPVYIVNTQENIAYARNLMLKHKISRLLVMDEEKLAGIITKKDIAYGFRQHDPIWRRRPIDRIPVEVMMRKDPITVSPDLQASRAAGLMLTHDISGLPVIDGDTIEGIITKSDIMASGEVDRIDATVGDIMEDVLTVSRYHSLNHVIDLIRERNDKILVINNDGTLAGVITESNIAFYEYFDQKGVPEKDIMHLRREETGGPKNLRHVRQLSGVAEDVMSRPVITINPGEPISSAIALMRRHQINSIIAETAGEIKGILKRDDILKEVAQ